MTNKMIEIVKEKIAKYSHCFNQSKEDNNLYESDSSLRSLQPTVIHYNYFKAFYLNRPDVYEDIPFSII